MFAFNDCFFVNSVDSFIHGVLTFLRCFCQDRTIVVFRRGNTLQIVLLHIGGVVWVQFRILPGTNLIFLGEASQIAPPAKQNNTPEVIKAKR